MSEQSPERQEKPKVLTDTCDGCGNKYKITAQTATGVHFEKQPECDFLLCACPKCSFKTRIFVDEGNMKIAIQHGIEVADESDYAPDQTYKDWLKIHGFAMPETHELTNRHEALVHKFGEALLTMPNDLLMDGFESEHSRPYPDRWM